VTSHGIFYVTCDPKADLVRLFDPVTRRDRRVGAIEVGLPPFGLPVSPDGRSIYYSKWHWNGADVMLIDHFK
jgi:hypothetical protein